MQIGRYTPRYKPNQTSIFRSIGGVSAAQDKPYPNKPPVAQDIPDVQQAAFTGTPPSLSTVPTAGDMFRQMGMTTAGAYQRNMDTYGQPYQQSMLSRGDWGNKAPAFMPTEYRDAVSALAPAVSKPISPDEFNALLSPEAMGESGIPFRDPVLARRAVEFAGRAQTARNQADTYRNKSPVIRRFAPLLNNSLNREEQQYRTAAAAMDEASLRAENDAIRAGELMRNRVSGERAGALAGRLGMVDKYVNTLNAGYGTGAQAAQIGNDRARIDLARANAIANTPPLEIMGLNSVLASAPSLFAAERALHEADPAIREQERKFKQSQGELNMAAVRASTNATNQNVEEGQLKMDRMAEGQLPSAVQALNFMQRNMQDNARDWLQNSTIALRDGYGDKLADPAMKAQYDTQLGELTGAAFAAQFEKDQSLRDALASDYYDTFLANISQIKGVGEPQMQQRVFNSLAPQLAKQMQARYPNNPQQQQRQVQLIANQIVRRYQLKQQQMMQGE